MRFIDGFTQDDGNVIPSRWESFAPVTPQNPIDNTPSLTGEIADNLPDLKNTQLSELLNKNSSELGTIKPYKNDDSDLLKEDITLSDDLLAQNKPNDLPQQIQNIQDNFPDNLAQQQEQRLKNIQPQLQQTEKAEQTQLSQNLSEYIDNLLNNYTNINVENKTNIPTLKGYITNTPDVVESEQTNNNPIEYLDNKGNSHILDKNGNEIKNNLNIWDSIFNKTNKTKYNIDSWINKPSREMDKKKTEIALNILTAPLGIGEIATTRLASNLIPLLGEKIAQYVAEGIGNGIVSGTIEGTVKNIENDDKQNPITTIINDVISNSKKGAIDGYIQGQLKEHIHPKNKNYLELLSEWLKFIKK